MLIEVVVKSLAIRQQTAKSGNVLHWQMVGMETGDGEWPVVFEMFRPDGVPLSIGTHKVKLAFKANQYNGLEVNPFDTKEVATK